MLRLCSGHLLLPDCLSQIPGGLRDLSFFGTFCSTHTLHVGKLCAPLVSGACMQAGLGEELRKGIRDASSAKCSDFGASAFLHMLQSFLHELDHHPSHSPPLHSASEPTCHSSLISQPLHPGPSLGSGMCHPQIVSLLTLSSCHLSSSPPLGVPILDGWPDSHSGSQSVISCHQQPHVGCPHLSACFTTVSCT